MKKTTIIPEETRSRSDAYLKDLCSGYTEPGARLSACLDAPEQAAVTSEGVLDKLINTKVPQIFAESAVYGDGEDWNLVELGILGDISIAVPVTVYDNGHHTAPVPHAVPFPGTLVFTPGALLRNGKGNTPADWEEVARADGSLCPDGYFRLYERRLLPVFQHVDAAAQSQGKPAFLTIPGLGCGQFAGPFREQLGAALREVLVKFLTRHGASFPHIRAVYYDPYNECENARMEVSGISLLVRPLLKGNDGKSQLCVPAAYEEEGDDFAGCALFSIVAWDHVSWPGNDFYGGSRCTDDGVKAAATNSMAVLTGIDGQYDPARGAYLPPAPCKTWGEVVIDNALRL